MVQSQKKWNLKIPQIKNKTTVEKKEKLLRLLWIFWQKKQTERKNYNEKEVTDLVYTDFNLQNGDMYFLPFPVFKNLLNAKEKEKKNLGKDLVEIFAALLMLKNSEFCRRPRTKSTLLLMLLLKKIW